jgi:hypothetical protein
MFEKLVFFPHINIALVETLIERGFYYYGLLKVRSPMDLSAFWIKFYGRLLFFPLLIY